MFDYKLNIGRLNITSFLSNFTYNKVTKVNVMKIFKKKV